MPACGRSGPSTQAALPEHLRVAARAALESGRAAMADRAYSSAVLWLERARRLVPADPLVLHLLASALSHVDPASGLGAIEKLVAAAPDYRDARLTLAALHLRRGNAAAASGALDDLLRNFAVPCTDSFISLADRIVRLNGRDGCIGWAGATGGGVAHVSAAGFSLAFDDEDGFLRSAACGGERLPENWRNAAFLRVTSPDGRVLGGKIDLAAIRHTEGAVFCDRDGHVHGWALAPADPDSIVIVDLYKDAADSPFASVAADDAAMEVEHPGGAQHARGFRFDAGMVLASSTLRIVARGGGELAGSPISLAAEAAASRRAARRLQDRWRALPVSLAAFAPPPARSTPPRAGIDIILIADGGASRAFSLLPPATRIVAIGESGTAQGAGLKSGGADFLLHSPEHSCPPAASLNAGLRHAAGRDVLILHGRTRLPEGAVARLAEAAYAAPDTGTVTPMTTGEGPTRLALPEHDDAMAGAADAACLDTVLQALPAGPRIDLPYCGSDCTFIRHDCLAETGLFRDDIFPAHAAAIIDFARRAAMLGWRHVAAANVLVAADASAPAAARSSSPDPYLDRLERLHPGLGALAGDFSAEDRLRPVRAASDARRWEHGRRDGAVVLVTHDSGGGVERFVNERVAAIRARGLRAIVLRPRGGFALSDGTARTHPDLVFADVDSLAGFLAPDRPLAVELHHIAAHARGIERLAGRLRVPFDCFVHDYAALCPRITFCAAGSFCGVPDDSRLCDDCIADHGARIPLSGPVGALRAQQAGLLGAARRVVVATPGSARLLRRFFPRIEPDIVPWEDDARWPPAAAPEAAGEVRVAVVGALGVEKGFQVLLDCARDAARRALALRFTVIGHTIDDSRLLDTGRVFVTGPFAEGEALKLLTQAAPSIGFLPSIWPETWCYALSAMWEAGLHVLAFDLGAQAERIRARKAGTLVPAGSRPGALNDRLLELSTVRDMHVGR